MKIEQPTKTKNYYVKNSGRSQNKRKIKSETEEPGKGGSEKT